MKICFIGKYPPIEGGVSMQSYWSVRGLASRGHQLYVVTNADEVEEAYRLHLDEEDGEWLEPRFDAVGGLVRLRNTERFSPGRMSHIPVANPFVTKLASVATQVIRQHDCDLIYASYLEPYGMAGHLASQWTGVPYVVKHAGSDLDRLMKVPDLSTAYGEVFRRASRVLTISSLTERFLRMGVEGERIQTDIGFGLPTEVFNPAAAALDVNDLLSRLSRRGPARIRELIKAQPAPIDLSLPTIGIYGKAGEFKGTYDLIAALAQLKREGLDFNFLAMTHGTQAERFRRVLRESDLQDRTWILPFIPHWRVPGFIRACTAVCFLERDFPIAIHGPMIAREVIACGVCLILSNEIASKQAYRDRIVDGENMLIVTDPKDHAELAARLRFVISNPPAARGIGARGHEVSLSIEDGASYVGRFESLFLEVSGEANERVAATSTGEATNLTLRGADESGSSAESLASALPCTSFLLADYFDKALARHREPLTREGNGFVEQAYDFCELLETLSQTNGLQSAPPFFSEVLRLEKTALSLSRENGGSPPFPHVDRYAGRTVTEEGVAELRPLGSNRCRVEEFAYDMPELIFQLRQRQLPITEPSRKQSLLLFHTAPNLTATIVKINVSTKELLELCDGERTTRALLAELAARYGLDPATDESDFKRGVITTLGHLYKKGVIIFC